MSSFPVIGFMSKLYYIMGKRTNQPFQQTFTQPEPLRRG
ncbi:hypothetical protein KNP414_05415 [Paenibacillus mucilaginosus KNP414]|uniref:Uncharacterized protein n=1 Tax=Paenibacillus mucilaginosus (strain KNP414) TaxID=1036673 RepID=F8FGB9_PAEMK|nr:hypothetical protein KNP414_05415 [Paenibacillus mucilaginosus KNP414]